MRRFIAVMRGVVLGAADIVLGGRAPEGAAP